MKGRQIALGQFRGREAAALLEDGRLSDLLIDSDAPRPGAIYRAIAGRPMKGQGALVLDTPDGPAFLRQTKGISPGQPLLVQVTGYAEPGKALPVTTRVLFKSRYAIVTPDAPGFNVSRAIRDEDRREELLALAHAHMDEGLGGLILRSGCAEADDGEIAEDIAAMAGLAAAVLGDAEGNASEKLTEGDGPHLLAWREWVAPAQVETGPDSFEELGILDAIEALAAPDVSLGGGARMFVEPTRALVAVDVNTGGDHSPAAGLKANMAAARLLPAQLRLRGLGGQITLDLAPMPKKDRRSFEQALKSALRGDPVETALAGWTPLGHFELQRKRERQPLADVLAQTAAGATE